MKIKYRHSSNDIIQIKTKKNCFQYERFTLGQLLYIFFLSFSTSVFCVTGIIVISGLLTLIISTMFQ